MRRIGLVLLTFVVVLASCKKVDKVKSYFHRDIKKVDSVVSMAVDSLAGKKSDTLVPKTEKGEKITQQKEKELFQGAYYVFSEAISKKDMYLIRQFCYFPDSVFIIGMQGIFQVLSFEPIEAILENINVLGDSAFSCTLDFSHFPDINQTANPPKGCFAQKITDFYKFSAIIELEREANLPINPDIVKKAKDIESKIDYAVLNSYLGWTFYFIKENGKFYLAAIDYNQY